MTVRGTNLLLVLGLPAALLLIFGPRQMHQVPPGRTVIRCWETWSGIEALAMPLDDAVCSAKEGAPERVLKE